MDAGRWITGWGGAIGVAWGQGDSRDRWGVAVEAKDEREQISAYPGDWDEERPWGTVRYTRVRPLTDPEWEAVVLERSQARAEREAEEAAKTAKRAADLDAIHTFLQCLLDRGYVEVETDYGPCERSGTGWSPLPFVAQQPNEQGAISYRAHDGDRVYRIARHAMSDDVRTSYLYPSAEVARKVAVEIATVHGLTRQWATEWIDDYAGCYGEAFVRLIAAVSDDQAETLDRAAEALAEVKRRRQEDLAEWGRRAVEAREQKQVERLFSRTPGYRGVRRQGDGWDVLIGPEGRTRRGQPRADVRLVEVIGRNHRLTARPVFVD